MLNRFKLFLKDHFYYQFIKERFTPALQATQRQLYLQYRAFLKNNTLPNFNETGFRVFSQFEEDGKLLYIFSLLAMPHKTFVEIGADDGINSNCANLAFHFNWTGLFIDGNSRSIKRGQKFYAKHPHPWMYQPTFVCSKVTRENINDLITNAGLHGEIGLLSIDIDGNDYWVWQAIEAVQPQVVVIETHVEFGMNNIVVPYDADYMYPGKHPVYHGASPVAMNNLAARKGYRLVGANEYGFNFIFLKNGLLDKELPKVSVASVLQHPSIKEGLKKFEPIKDWEYVAG